RPLTSEDNKLFFDKSFRVIKDLYLWHLRIVKSYLVNPKPFYRLYRQLFKEYKFSDCKIPFSAVAVDMCKGETVAIEEGSLLKSIAASSALPGFFPPVKIGEKIFVDGGVLMPLPSEVINDKVDFVIGVNLNERFLCLPQVKSVLDTLFIVDRIRHNKIVEEGVKYCDFVISPPLYNYTWADFEDAEAIIDIGYEEASLKREELLGKLKEARFLTFFKRWGKWRLKCKN
ncbi:MAG: patatin-like phospholipase family protein, partial [Candidatus Omnitrophica bacterium]|nr:patatin-like phospholipase family protein [Candidatus Omnitrophota bacterium]